MKKVISSLLTFAASAALIAPLAFPNVVKGCDDDSYRFGNSATGGANEEYGEDAAAFAKKQFCDAVKAYK